MKTLAIGLAIAELIAAIVMVIVAIKWIETIVVTGPILALIGLSLALVTRSLHSWAVLAFALSAPLVTALISFMIAVFELGPPEARTPTLVTLMIYLVLVSPVAPIAFLRLVYWNTTPVRIHRGRLRFSVKTLLLTMTGTAIVIAGGKLLFDNTRHYELLYFGGYAFVVIVLSAAAVYACLATRVPSTADKAH